MTREELLDVRQKFIELVLDHGWSPMYSMGLCGVNECAFRKYFKDDPVIQKIMQESKERRRIAKRGPK